MNKLLLKFAGAFFLGFLFFSCSNAQNIEIAHLDDDTLKIISSEKEKTLIWTRELESVRLTRDYSKNAFATSDVHLLPTSITTAETQNLPIYPHIQGFGSLDTSELSSELKTFLNEFCVSVSEWNLKDVKVDENAVFSLVLFKNDVEEIYKQEKGEKFSSSTVETTENGEALKAKYFDRWLFGEPFFDENYVQVPIRFFRKDWTLDVEVYVETGAEFKILQIVVN